jgi:hypothetical protein
MLAYALDEGLFPPLPANDILVDITRRLNEQLEAYLTDVEANQEPSIVIKLPKNAEERQAA